jgi:hypothetical protein
MGTELDAQIEIKFIVHPDEGPVRVVTHPAHILRRQINQPRLPSIGRLKIRILLVHKCFDVGAAMPGPWQTSRVTPVISGFCSLETKPPTKPYPVMWQGRQISFDI